MKNCDGNNCVEIFANFSRRVINRFSFNHSENFCCIIGKLSYNASKYKNVIPIHSV